MNDSSSGWPAVSFLGSMTVSLIAAADSSPRYWGIKLVCLVIQVLEKKHNTTTITSAANLIPLAQKVRL